MIDRRHFLGGALALGASACIPPDQSPIGRLQAELRLIEGKADATLGVCLFDTGTGRSVGINETRRFGHTSSFKLSLAALLLQRHAAGTIDADRRVTWTEADLIFHAPFTKERLGTGATLRELARAAQITSDNPATNILLRALGGPAAMTAFWRSIGDTESRLDRYELGLNEVPPTEFRDTTTPAAMARTVAKIVYGDVLPPTGRAELKGWMIQTESGLRYVRAGLPTDWAAGDKTGFSGMVGDENNFVDIGFAESPAGRAPITWAAYIRTRQPEATMQARADRALAEVGRVIKEFAEPERGLPVIGKLY
ncbi:class A beta-lactamase [Erythrobacter sp. NE805]|uniref:class A beta-lactamase n=1 Tax=Erythrobacter sp. NE805 TaxID=3389875 RepID=UPI00396AFDDE